MGNSSGKDTIRGWYFKEKKKEKEKEIFYTLRLNSRSAQHLTLGVLSGLHL
jgi:hypothetical protein